MTSTRSAFLLLCALGGAAVGPAGAAEIKGAVTDANGGALPEASVALENVATGAETAVNTDAGGRYAFPAVPVGIYRVSALVSGFSQDARTISLAAPEESVE